MPNSNRDEDEGRTYLPYDDPIRLLQEGVRPATVALIEAGGRDRAAGEALAELEAALYGRAVVGDCTAARLVLGYLQGGTGEGEGLQTISLDMVDGGEF